VPTSSQPPRRRRSNRCRSHDRVRAFLRLHRYNHRPRDHHLGLPPLAAAASAAATATPARAPRGQTLNVSMSMRFISSSALHPAGRAARPPGDHWGTNNRRIPGNRIQPKTAEPSVDAVCLDDCHAEGRGFESLQPLSERPAFAGLFSARSALPAGPFRGFRGQVRFQSGNPRPDQTANASSTVLPSTSEGRSSSPGVAVSVGPTATPVSLQRRLGTCSTALST
jgi:hypothetical protein